MNLAGLMVTDLCQMVCELQSHFVALIRDDIQQCPVSEEGVCKVAPSTYTNMQ